MRRVLGLGAALLLLTLPVAVHAAPPPGMIPDPGLSAWFLSLKQPASGISCCSMADCRIVEDRIKGDSYQAWAKDQWIDIPERVVLHRENPTGGAVLCATDSLSIIWCFVPGNGV